MRYKALLIIGLSSLLILTPHALFAAGNVLLPSTGDTSTLPSTSAAPNLGLTAAPAPAADSPGATPAPPGAPQTDVSQGTQAAAPVAMPPAPAPFDPSKVISPINKTTAATLADGVVPTQVIHQENPAAILAQANKDLPFALTVGIGNRSFFGAQDVDLIRTKLGLSAAQVQSNCILSLRGFLQTDKGGYIVDSGPSPQITVRYDGTLRNVLLSARAMCLASGPLPPGSGYLTQIEDRYSVALQPIPCAPPTRQATQLVVSYTGDEKTQCSYQ